jgi:hypothetical protein
MPYIEVAGRPGAVLIPGAVAGVPSGAIRDAYLAAVNQKPLTVAQYDALVDWWKNNTPTVYPGVQKWATDRHETAGSPATLREVLASWPALRGAVDAQNAKLDALAQTLANLPVTGGGTTDPVALASALAPLLPHVDQQTVEAALRTVLGSVDNQPPPAG